MARVGDVAGVEVEEVSIKTWEVANNQTNLVGIIKVRPNLVLPNLRPRNSSSKEQRKSSKPRLKPAAVIKHENRLSKML